MNIMLSLILSALLTLPFTAEPPQEGGYTIQVEATQDRSIAEQKVRQLKEQGLEAYWVKGSVPGKGVYYRVRIGQFPNKEAAMNFGASLKRQGIAPDFLLVAYQAPSPITATPPAQSSATPPDNKSTDENKRTQTQQANTSPNPSLDKPNRERPRPGAPTAPVASVTPVTSSVAPNPLEIYRPGTAQLLQPAVPDPDVEKVKFVLGECDTRRGRYRSVYGVAPPSVDLADGLVAERIVNAGARFAESRCSQGDFGNINVYLWYGDPSTLEGLARANNFKWGTMNANYPTSAPHDSTSQVVASFKTTPGRGTDRDIPGLIWWGNNYPHNDRDRKARWAANMQKIAEREARERAERLANEAKIAADAEAARERVRAFGKRYGATKIISMSMLEQNPFP